MKHQSTGRIILGLSLIVFGTTLVFMNLDLIPSFNTWRLWPLILVMIGVTKLFEDKHGKELPEGFFWIGIGLLFLASSLEMWDFGFRESWPVIIILIGLSMVWKSSLSGRRRNHSNDVNHHTKTAN